MDPQELRRPHNMFTAGKLVAELVHSMLSATVREISALQPLQGPSSSLLLAELRAWSLYTCICTDVSPKTPAWCFLKARYYKQAAASCVLAFLLWLLCFGCHFLGLTAQWIPQDPIACLTWCWDFYICFVCSMVTYPSLGQSTRHYSRSLLCKPRHFIKGLTPSLIGWSASLSTG